MSTKLDLLRLRAVLRSGNPRRHQGPHVPVVLATIGRRVAMTGVIPLALLLSGCETTRSEGRCLVDMATDLGIVRIELFPNLAPLSSANFLMYAELGHYDSASFYRATEQQSTTHGASSFSIVQGGTMERSFEGTNEQVVNSYMSGPLPPVMHEPTSVTGLRNLRGSVALGRLGADSARSEFFVSLADNAPLDQDGAGHPDGLGYAVFGRVVRGMEILDAVARRPKAATPNFFTSQILQEPLKIRGTTLVSQADCHPPQARPQQ